MPANIYQPWITKVRCLQLFARDGLLDGRFTAREIHDVSVGRFSWNQRKQFTSSMSCNHMDTIGYSWSCSEFYIVSWSICVFQNCIYSSMSICCIHVFSIIPVYVAMLKVTDHQNGSNTPKHPLVLSYCHVCIWTLLVNPGVFWYLKRQNHCASPRWTSKNSTVNPSEEIEMNSFSSQILY